MRIPKTSEHPARGQESYRPLPNAVAEPNLLPLKVSLLGVSFDSPNLGVGALLYGSVGAILRSFPNATVSVLDYGRVGYCRTLEVAGRKISVEFVNMRFSKKFYLHNNIAYLILLAFLNRYLFPEWLRQRVIQGNPVLRHMQETDVFASIAGGDSFSDIYGLTRLLYETLPQFLVLMIDKPLILFPQTLGPFKSYIARKIARSVLSRATFVCSRDAHGLESLEGLVDDPPDGKYEFCHDVGFLVEPVEPRDGNLVAYSARTSRPPVVGLNVSGLLRAGGYDGKNMFGLRTDYTTTIRKLLAFLIEEKKVHVVLVPHVYAEPRSGGAFESDERACNELFEESKSRYEGKLFVIRGIHSTPEMKYMIGQCDLFIGSRMHACIAALSQGVPAVALSYSNKFKGVWESIHLGQLVADPRQLEDREIIQIVGVAFEERKQLRHQLQETMPQIKNQIAEKLRRILTLPPS
jgi:colanic acid/amylovoran biosynthesis protein